MSKYQVKTRTFLDGQGSKGAWMFVLSPLIQWAAWRWITNPAVSTIILLAAGAAFLLGFVLLLVGREQHSTIEEI